LTIFGVGLVLVIGLVQVFVRPIQVLTDGVRAIGDGNLEGKLDIQGPAEIGAIAGVFNEITEKFRKAQTSILEQEKMQKEIEVAKQIQQSLLPRRRPQISGYDIAPLYQAAAEVGGDYYDFVQVDDDTIGVVVADVSGKGVPGSLVMTMIRTALRMEARGNRNASDVMAKMNAFVTDDMKKGMFVTMFYVILDSKNRVISYASAGHNPMILYRHETRETFFLNPRGFPVGISLPDESLFRRSISVEKVRLKKDDMLVIYTDGVTEAMNERREQYGEERLLEMVRSYGYLSPEEFIAKLDLDIKRFTLDYPQSDDITVVSVKEKMTADDVLYGIRKKLIEMVEVQGMSVKDACQQMRVSPATFYRYKKRLETMGERGLRNDVLRDDVSLKRVSLEARKAIIRTIAANPDFGAKRIAEEYNQGREPSQHVSERMVYEELKRLNLNTKDLRVDYLRRNRLRRAEGAAPEADQTAAPRRDLVDDLLREIPGVAPPAGARDDGAPPIETTERVEGVGLAVSSSDGITEIRLSGHVDSSSSAALERKLQDLIAGGALRIAVDLGETSYVSSGGWGLFVGEVRGLRDRGGDLVLAGMTSEVFDVYELLGFADVLRAFPTLGEARAYLALPPEERRARPLPSRPEVSPEEIATAHGIEVGGDLAGASLEWQSLRIEATTVGERGEIAVLQLKGIIDTVSAERLRAALEQVLAGGRNRVVVDMTSVEYVSSGGWGVFTERLREVRRAGGDIKLFGMDPDVYYVFTMLGFNIVLASFDIFSDAVDDFKRAAAQVEDDLPVAEAGAAPAHTLLGTPGMDVVWSDGGNGVRVATLSGVVETTAVSLLSDELSRELSRGPRAIVFDLERVEYISSSGWGQFARAFEATGAVALAAMGPDLTDVYACLEFSAFIPALATRADAVAAVSGQRPAPRAPGPPSTPPPPPETAARDSHADGLDEVLGAPGVARAADAAPPVRPAGGPPASRTTPGNESEPTLFGRGAYGDERGLRDDAAPPADLDVDSAVADRHVDRDRKLREIGWKQYGERLREHDGAEGSGDDQPGDDDERP
jgi:anti-anti-sigma factor